MTPRCALLLLLAPALAGCGFIKITTGKSASEAPASPPAEASAAEPTSEPLEAERAKLAKAESALEAGQAEEAIATARHLRELEEPSDRTSVRTAWERIRAGAIAIEGAAHRKAGDELEAVLSLGRDRFDLRRCKEAIDEDLCDGHATFLGEAPAFRKLVKGGRLYSFYRGTFGHTPISNTSMKIVTNHFTSDADYVALWINASGNDVRRQEGKEKVTYQLRGKSESLSGTSCNQRVGQVEIEGQRFDVKRCRKNTYHYQGAVLSFTLPTDEAEKATFAPDQRVLVVFRKKNLRRLGGNRWTLGDARAAIYGRY